MAPRVGVLTDTRTSTSDAIAAVAAITAGVAERIEGVTAQVRAAVVARSGSASGVLPPAHRRRR